MMRSDIRGVTSVISSLRLEPKLYHTMLHFFRSDAYKISDIYDKWIRLLLTLMDLVEISDRLLILGDHLKMPKEGRRMPGIQVLHQESQNAGKSEFTEGHIIAHISAVAVNGKTHRSIPLISQRQESPPKIEGTNKPDGDTIITQMIDLAIQAVNSFTGKKAVIALDAYFAKASAFEAAAKAVSAAGEKLLAIVTRAPSDTVAYNVPSQPPKQGRGQPRIYGDKVQLYSLFSNMTKFTETTMLLYGKKTKVRYQCLDLIWKPTKGLLRFVLVEMNGKDRCVLMSSDLEMSPTEIIIVYGLRFKIESSFNEQKNHMGCFSYRFWTTALLKKKKWKKQESSADEKKKERVDNAKRAIEAFICLSTIATGILTIIAFKHNREIWQRYRGWIKTLRITIPSTAITKETLAQEFPLFVRIAGNLPLCSIINTRLRKTEFFYEDLG